MSDLGAGALLTILKRLAVDVLVGWMFLALFLITNNIYLATGLGLATGVLQALWMVLRRQPIDPMQWMTYALVLVLGGATIRLHNPTFVVFKPTIFEGALAAMMLRPGWQLRYAPARAVGLLPKGLMIFWGYLWAAAWFALAASNLLVARLYGLKAWAVWTNISPLVLVGVLIGLGVLVFPPLVRRRARVLGIDLKARPVSG